MKLGATDISKIYLGSTEVGKAYLGDTLVHGGTSPVLPYDAEIEYLGFTGSQYIDTGYVTTENSIISVGVKLNTVTKQARIVGNTTGYFEIYVNGSSNWCYSSNGSTYSTSTKVGTNTWTVSIDNVEKFGHYGASTRSIAKNTSAYFGECYLMARPSASSTFVQGNLYWGKIEDGGLVHDYIPVRVGQVGYLYDKISGRLLDNAGTDPFILGPDVI